jgi:hypothetical protein
VLEGGGGGVTVRYKLIVGNMSRSH